MIWCDIKLKMSTMSSSETVDDTGITATPPPRKSKAWPEFSSSKFRILLLILILKISETQHLTK